MGCRILVIEDNEQNMYLIHFLLQSNGHTVIEAMNGEEGIHHAQHSDPDLILLDIQLPGMDGYEIAAVIRTGLRRSHHRPPVCHGRGRKGSFAAGHGLYRKTDQSETFISQISPYFPA